MEPKQPQPQPPSGETGITDEIEPDRWGECCPALRVWVDGVEGIPALKPVSAWLRSLPSEELVVLEGLLRHHHRTTSVRVYQRQYPHNYRALQAEHPAFVRLLEAQPAAEIEVEVLQRALGSFLVGQYQVRVVSEAESQSIGARISAGMRAAQAEGVRIGRPLDHHSPETVRLIAELRSSGSSLRAIASHLNEDGVLTARGGKWYASTVRNILVRVAEGKVTTSMVD